MTNTAAVVAPLVTGNIRLTTLSQIGLLQRIPGLENLLPPGLGNIFVDAPV
jgi:hypothetical protein